MYGLPGLEERTRQLRAFVDAYKLNDHDRADFVDRMISLAVHAARTEAVEFNVIPETTTTFTEEGYPILWAITWRVRSASWMISNRTALEEAIV